ncbi:expressed unknown protein [Seminavis robusta]|uniref:Uncharacterized protein n=1 Tax=Seminavis robusta TaxID=568900 RepID=A0A9N8EHH6_9STRA|nr:expressed unknown protein [Seminavis robusta]|eukprot:Sro1176_g249240.1 n/a (295) ;mRNA; f:6803-7687
MVEVVVDCVILLPKHASVDAWFHSHALLENNKRGDSSIRVLQCHPEAPGCVWRGLAPCWLQSSQKTARRCLLAHLQLVGFFTSSTAASSGTNGMEVGHEELLEELRGKVYGRRVRLSLESSTTSTSNHQQRRLLLIWIQPPSTTYYQTNFSKTLITWEHTMILYQSLAAWISTLGGGFFFCRYLGTAVRLAKQQRQIALLMGDHTMAYKCTINEAYSYIYAGHFAKALQTIDFVDVLHSRVDTQKQLDTTIQNMCQSARLFCMRVRKASKKLKTSRTQQPARNIDDFQRIRVIQ